ncbi:MAG TPA: hypothetical protein VFG29_14775 [Syntrophales bacterium]|nr:hypothetical protein [Syntrophales bacterium]
MLPRKLIIFDYSGTLSRESTLFGEPDYLMKRLKESGLMDLGVTSPGVFWEQIVNPTWVEGSTTQVGYKKVVEDRITAIISQNKSYISGAKISDAASSFVDSYLSHSRIDNRWQPVLEKLNMHPPVRAIIATDHYAEATGYILQFLDELHIQAVSAKAAMAALHSTSVVVANSADLGFHKDHLLFWEILKNDLCMDGIRHILLVDDFGSNEQIDDSYSVPEKVEERKRDTVRLLQEVFSAGVQAIPFIVGDKKDEEAFFNLITETAATIDLYLATVNDGQ